MTTILESPYEGCVICPALSTKPLKIVVKCRVFEGIVTRNVVHGHHGVIVLSQKPYLTDGSLREQVRTRFVLSLCHSL